jgi:uncharacterized protein
MRRRILLLGSAVMSMIGFWMLSPCQAQTHQQVTVGLLSGPFGTGSYVISAALEEVMKKHHPWLRISHSESPGFVFSRKKFLKEPELKKSLMVGHGPVVNWLGEQGIAPFDVKLPPVQLVANYNLGAYWLATTNAKIKTPKDMEGKKIALGRAPQINWAIEPVWAVRYGWGIGDKVNIQYVGVNESIQAMLDGLADVAIAGAYFDPITKKVSLSPQTLELIASGRTIYHIPWGEEAVNKTIAKGMPLVPFTMPAKSFQGLDQDLSVFADIISWCVSPEFPADLSYEIAKTIIQYYKTFADYSDLGKLISPEALPWGWKQAEIHPGALKAYKEAGILK